MRSDSSVRVKTEMQVLMFGAEIMKVLGSSAYAVVGQFCPFQVTMPHSMWLNGNHAAEVGRFRTSMSPANAYRKFAELMLGREDPNEEIEKTPRVFASGSPFKSCDWMGGVRADKYIVAVSGQAEEHDRLIAAVMVFSRFRTVRCLPELYKTERDARVFEIVVDNSHDRVKLLGFLSGVCGRDSLWEGPGDILGILVTTNDVRDLGTTIGVVVTARK